MSYQKKYINDQWKQGFNEWVCSSSLQKWVHLALTGHDLYILLHVITINSVLDVLQIVHGLNILMWCVLLFFFSNVHLWWNDNILRWNTASPPPLPQINIGKKTHYLVQFLISLLLQMYRQTVTISCCCNIHITCNFRYVNCNLKIKTPCILKFSGRMHLSMLCVLKELVCNLGNIQPKPLWRNPTKTRASI